MTKTTVMGGASTSEVMKSWREVVAQVTTTIKPTELTLSRQGAPLPASHAEIVSKWRRAGEYVERVNRSKASPEARAAGDSDA